MPPPAAVNFFPSGRSKWPYLFFPHYLKLYNYNSNAKKEKEKRSPKWPHFTAWVPAVEAVRTTHSIVLGVHYCAQQWCYDSKQDLSPALRKNQVQWKSWQCEQLLLITLRSTRSCPGCWENWHKYKVTDNLSRNPRPTREPHCCSVYFRQHVHCWNKLTSQITLMPGHPRPAF